MHCTFHIHFGFSWNFHIYKFSIFTTFQHLHNIFKNPKLQNLHNHDFMLGLRFCKKVTCIETFFVCSWSSIQLSIHPPIHLSFHPSTLPPFDPSTHSSNHLPSIHLAILAIHPSIHPSTHSSSHLAIHPSIHPSSLPYILPFN